MIVKNAIVRFISILVIAVCLAASAGPASAAGAPATATAAFDPTPPSQPVKLIFIHHSTGQNWLADDYGGLGISLKNNNYFVSDTNYGWGPNSIGDRTDIPNWTEWFTSGDTTTYMNALFTESGQNSSYTRLSTDPGGQNVIVMFKSCFPNSSLEGNPTDPPSASGWLTVGHAKWVYNQLLSYFGAHPEKLFIVVTAPPLQDGTYAANARAFNQWLMNNWLADNSYTLNNVAVFDFYNVLTGPANHHRYFSGAIEHVFTAGMNTLYYPSGDDHPSVAGSVKATNEFVPLLNIFYNRWHSSLGPRVLSVTRASANPTSATSVDFTVKFSEAVTGVDAGDFKLTKTGSSLSGLAISPTLGGSGNTYTVSVGTGTGSGTLRLDVKDDDSIVNAGLVPLGGSGANNGNFVAGETYAVRPVSRTFFSLAGQDGWVLESAETSSIGGRLNSTGNLLLLGDDASNRQYRAILGFNTALLTDTAIIASAVLMLKPNGPAVGTSPFSALGNLWVDVRNGPFGTNALQLADFGSAASAVKAGSFNRTLSGGWYTSTLKAAGLAKISKTGITQFRLYFGVDDNNNHIADYMRFLSGNFAGGQPQLVISYTLP